MCNFKEGKTTTIYVKCKHYCSILEHISKSSMENETYMVPP